MVIVGHVRGSISKLIRWLVRSHRPYLVEQPIERCRSAFFAAETPAQFLPDIERVAGSKER